MKKFNSSQLRPGDKGEIDGMAFEVGSGNIFRDLGLPDPELRLAKSILARQINAIIRSKGWTQKKAAEALGTSQPTISLLKKGMLKSITYDRLISWLVTLKQNVTITVSPAVRNARVEIEVVPRDLAFSRTMSVHERGARKYRKLRITRG